MENGKWKMLRDSFIFHFPFSIIKIMNFEEYQQEAKQTALYQKRKKNLEYPTLGLAGEAGAGCLVLVKEVDGLYAEWPARGEPIARMTAAELAALRPAGVDEHLPTLLEAASFETWVISGRDPERLAELLEQGTTVGTRVA